MSSIDFKNQSLLLTLIPLNDTWILPIFVLCLVGILLTVIIAITFICLSFRRFNGHFVLTNLFICFSVALIYVIIIVFLFRANEIFCGLREFLTQLAYAFLFSSLLCRYIMQWLGSRILSRRTKQLTSLLIYFLLIVIQIPIGILWWYFTKPRVCSQEKQNILSSKSTLPEFRFDFEILRSTPPPSCSNRCLVDYRFYATFTYCILELFFCTLIAVSLFLCRSCHRSQSEKGEEKLISISRDNILLTFFNMFAFVLIDLVWLTWTCIYYFAHPFYIFPALIFGLFLIATICLLLILLPQVYYYAKMKPNEKVKHKSQTNIQSFTPSTTPKPTLYNNRLASADDIDDKQLLLIDKSNDQKSSRNKRKEQTLSNVSDLSADLGSSGTYLPITRTPRGQFKGKSADKTSPSEKLDQLIYGDEQKNIQSTNETAKVTTDNNIKGNLSANDIPNRQDTLLAPLQRQLTSSSIASDFVSPVSSRSFHHRTDVPQNVSNTLRTSSSLYYPSTQRNVRRDETLIPILCNTERPRTSTPLQMRYYSNNGPLPSSVPTTRRIYSGTDLRYGRPVRDQIYPAVPSPMPTLHPPFYSPQPHQQYLYVDPYRTVPSRLGGNTWHSVLLQSGTAAGTARPHFSHRRFYTDHRSLSQRLWDIDSGDDDDDAEEDIIKVAGRMTPEKPAVNTFHGNHLSDEDNILLHIDDDTEDDSYEKKYVQV